jgi:hypothetical protein
MVPATVPMTAFLLRGLHGLFAAAFALSAAVQWNDPDPLPWIGIYGAALVLSLLAVSGRPPGWQATVVFLIAGIWALSLSPSLPRLAEPEVRGLHMRAGDVTAEEARECGGLLVVMAGSLLVSMDANARRRRSHLTRSRPDAEVGPDAGQENA